MPLVLAGSGEVLACVPVVGRDERIGGGLFDESCSS